MRFADDFTAGFEYREDAEAFLAALRERFAKFSLELHPGKTRLIEFGRHAAPQPGRPGRAETGNVQLPGVHAYLLGPHAAWDGSGSSGKPTRKR